MTTTICRFSERQVAWLSECYSRIAETTLNDISRDVAAAGGVPAHVLCVLEGMVVTAVYNTHIPDGGSMSQEEAAGMFRSVSKRLADLRLAECPAQGHA